MSLLGCTVPKGGLPGEGTDGAASEPGIDGGAGAEVGNVPTSLDDASAVDGPGPATDGPASGGDGPVEEVSTTLPTDAPLQDAPVDVGVPPDLGPGKRNNGQVCAAAADCLSNFCVDGVCCFEACSGQCQACNVAGNPGTCLPVTGDPRGSRTRCGGAGTCAGTCNGVAGAACTYAGTEKTCGAASCTNSVAQPAATCDGKGACVTPPTVSCGAYPCVGTDCAGGCSASNPCVGETYCQSGKCVPKLGNGTMCADGSVCKSGQCSSGVCCDSACTGDCQSCSLPGSTGTCSFKPSSTVCRDSKGDCDPAETCTGSSATCPADTLRASSFVCRPANGVCDLPETCTGTTPSCPATNAYKPASTVCRGAADLCDEVENCSGTSADCPPDGYKAPATVCRAAADVCDQADTCSGSSAACPNTFKSSSTTCRPAAGMCDQAENCSGSSAACPGDSFLGSSTVCRPAAGPCDLAESCSGGSANCPGDGKRGAGYQCNGAGGNATCDPPDTCDGSNNNCPTVFANGASCVNGNMCGATCSNGGCSGGSSCSAYTCNGPSGCFGSCMTDQQCNPGNVCTGPASPTSAGTCAPPQGTGPPANQGLWRTAPGYYGYTLAVNTTLTAPTGQCPTGGSSYVRVATGALHVQYYRDAAHDVNCAPPKVSYSAYVPPTATSPARYGFVQLCSGNFTQYPIGDYGGSFCANSTADSIFAEPSGTINGCTASDWAIFLEYKCSY
jgi:hypothetical protein